MQEFEADKILYSEVCGNGLEITVFDMSRKIAGDRWLVRIKCIIESRPLNTSLKFSSPEVRLPEQEKGMAESEEKVSKLLFRERNFVDAREREDAVAALLEQLQIKIFPYLRTQSAVQKLLALKNRAQQEQSVQTDADNLFAHLDRDEGPADFSSLFREK